MNYLLLFAQGTQEQIVPMTPDLSILDASWLLPIVLKLLFIVVFVVAVAVLVTFALKSRPSRSEKLRKKYGIDVDNLFPGDAHNYDNYNDESDRKTDESFIGKYTYSRKAVMTPTERDFFVKLYVAAKTYYWVFAKVSLHDVVKNNEYAGWSKIAQKHVDFVLCDPRDASVVLAIELDDWTHNKSNAQKRDAQKDDVLESAGVPLLRVKVGDNDAAIIAVKNKLLEITRRA